MRKKDLYWLAGLLEGDGSFYFQATPSIKLSMTDRDVVKKAALIMGASLLGPYIDKRTNTRKPMWMANLCGPKALSLLEKLLPHMGERRTARIKSIQLECEKRPGRGNHPRNRGSDHPNSKLNPVAVRVIRFLFDAGVPKLSLARAHSVSVKTIEHVGNRYSWKSVE